MTSHLAQTTLNLNELKKAISRFVIFYDYIDIYMFLFFSGVGKYMKNNYTKMKNIDIGR